MDRATQKLIRILQIVNDGLKFAETKNSILLAFSSAAIAAIVTYSSTSDSIQNPGSLDQTIIWGISFCLFLCLLACLLSFSPMTTLEFLDGILKKIPNFFKKLFRSKDKYKLLDKEHNLYCFRHLQKCPDPEALLDAINQLYFDEEILIPYKKEDLDLASQIITKSKITFLKLNLFNLALYGLILSMIIAFVPVLILPVFS